MSVSEFSRMVLLADLAHGEIFKEIRASPAEGAALARRFGLIALDELEAALKLRAELSGVRVTGAVRGRVVQACGVTLAPVVALIEAPVDSLYVRPETLQKHGHEVAEATPDEEDVEPLSGPYIDIGELAAQSLALALDPYPRAPGAVWQGDEASLSSHPFAILKAMQEKG
ncbi:MAG: YceD family protein [Pseudomonadota bacterium]|jgi:uncharacterized metal-binding protein YceD (DUF177 family)